MSRRHRRLLLRTLLFLFALNSVSLALYFLFHPRPSSSPETLTLTPPSFPSLKTWPSLPSFLPWSFSPPPPARSCEAYFGHGFSRRIDVLRSSSSSTGGGGWFRCYHSETLASSICEGGRIRMDPGRISMSDGGEALETVMGRGEEQELPRYEPGAFEIEAGEEGIGRADRRVVDEEFLDRYVPQGGIELHTMRALIDSMRLVNPRELECTQAQLEETWEALFSSIRYAKNFSGPVCFRHAILSPLGYETAMFKGLTESITCQGAPAHILRENPDIRKTARLSEFGEMLRAAFGLLGDGNLPTKPLAGHNILFVRREDYLAHPRHSGKVQSRLTNEQEVFDAIKNWADDHRKCKINVVNGIFAHMCLKEQLRAIQEASVVVGAHGAGLTHLVAATPDTIVLEIISSLYRRPHFALISEWKGLEYHAINLPGSSAEPAAVINKLSRIMGSLGC
ncbi:beta-1,2-xylosyltransferase RCN11 isoform X2 [Phoenix dactylifera]|uniref:Beta-1,2-xylosyltransferase RCN11 isoform X2 n=1 Tax=Phoenix dactylifera TaxID=42345 RepID=A0A8B7D4W9_PHODC|nr:beta-1,2-xylosyltransferase RCN11 isoform X2 [Phoenix dactylifera]